jgi:uncharacterized membrane protein
MGVDIKLPIGLMFTIFGIILSIYGLVTNGNIEMYQRSLGINVNLWSGLFMLVFGVIMLLLSWKTKKVEE